MLAGKLKFDQATSHQNCFSCYAQIYDNTIFKAMNDLFFYLSKNSQNMHTLKIYLDNTWLG